MCMDRIARQKYESALEGTDVVAVTSLIVMLKCIKVSKRNNFHWVQRKADMFTSSVKECLKCLQLVNHDQFSSCICEELQLHNQSINQSIIYLPTLTSKSTSARSKYDSRFGSCLLWYWFAWFASFLLFFLQLFIAVCVFGNICWLISLFIINIVQRSCWITNWIATCFVSILLQCWKHDKSLTDITRYW